MSEEEVPEPKDSFRIRVRSVSTSQSSILHYRVNPPNLAYAHPYPLTYHSFML